jgi:integrase
VAELCLAYKRYAEGYYLSPDGSPSGSMDRIRAAVRILRKSYGPTLAQDIGPLALQAIQNKLAASSKTRRYCNHLLGAIKRMFKWAVSQELIPVPVYQALATVPGLKLGRSAAREPEPIGPVADEIVTQTLPHLPPPVAAIVRLQQLTGCRPGEACRIRPCDIDRSGEVWRYVPQSHKTAYRGKERIVFLGPQAQAVLLPWLLRGPESYCFSPSEWVAKQRRDRRTREKASPSRGRRGRKPKVQAHDYYSTRTYHRAITLACQKHDIAHWAPNQLRHAAATKIRAQFGGLEPVQAVLGHSHMNVSEVYAEKNLSLAEEIMRKIG